jgi:hypothetical protein
LDLTRGKLEDPHGRRARRCPGGMIFKCIAHAAELVNSFCLGWRAKRIDTELILAQRIHG